MGGATGQYEGGEKEVQSHKPYPLFFGNVPDNNNGDGKIGRPYEQVADDI